MSSLLGRRKRVNPTRVKDPQHGYASYPTLINVLTFTEAEYFNYFQVLNDLREVNEAYQFFRKHANKNGFYLKRYLVQSRNSRSSQTFQSFKKLSLLKCITLKYFVVKIISV
jgi:hypothetical protein